MSDLGTSSAYIKLGPVQQAWAMCVTLDARQAWTVYFMLGLGSVSTYIRLGLCV